MATVGGVLEFSLAEPQCKFLSLMEEDNEHETQKGVAELACGRALFLCEFLCRTNHKGSLRLDLRLSSAALSRRTRRPVQEKSARGPPDLHAGRLVHRAALAGGRWGGRGAPA